MSKIDENEKVDTGYRDKNNTIIYSNSKLRCISESYEGVVVKIGSSWGTDCAGFGDELLGNFDGEDDLEVVG